MINVSPQLYRGFSLRFWVTAIATMGIIFFTYTQPVLRILQNGGQINQEYHNELISTALSSDTLSVFLPALATIPLSAGYLEDIKNKASRFFLIRGSYSDYLLGHCITCWLCGGDAVLLGAGTAWGIKRIVDLYSCIPQFIYLCCIFG